MNLKDFKIIHEDKDSYRIGHPNGKELKVDKKGLTPEAHKNIQKLADGGVVDSTPLPPNNGYDLYQTNEDGSDGGGRNPASASSPVVAAADQASFNRVNPSHAPPEDPGLLSRFGAWIDPNSTDADSVRAYDAFQASQPAAGAPATTPKLIQPPARPSGPDPFQQASSAQGDLLNQEQGQAQDYLKGISNANGPTDKYIAGAQQQLADSTKQANDIAYARGIDDDKFAAELADQKKNYDPNRLFHNMNTGQKIASGISMFLSGLGSGASGQPNMAAKMMDDAVNRDIEQQKNDQSQTMNLWKMNREHYGDDMQANLATRNQLLTGVQIQLQRAASGAANNDAKMRAQQMLNQIQQEKISNNRQQGLLGAGQTPGSALQVDPLKLVPQMVPADHQKDVIKEIGDAQHVSQNKVQMGALWDQAAKENTLMRTGGGMLRTPGSVKALTLLGDPLIHDADGRVNEFEQKDFGNSFPQPGDSDATLKTKRAAFDSFIDRKGAAPTAVAYGLDPNKFASTTADPIAKLNPQQRRIYELAKANPNHPASALALKKLGVQ